jgi:hypothetical protein
MSTSIDAAEEAKLQSKPRYVRIDREQMFMAPVDVEALISAGPSGARGMGTGRQTGFQ